LLTARSGLRLHAGRRLASPIYYAGLKALGVPAVNRRFRDAGLILCYHNVVPANAGKLGDPGLHVPSDRFERQMRWLAAHYTGVDLHAFVNRLAAGDSLRAVAAVTFDDGYAGVFEHAVPILRALALPATVFLVAGAVGRSAGFWWDQPEIVEFATPGRRKWWLSELRGDERAILARHTRVGDRALPAWYRPCDVSAIRATIGHDIRIGAHSVTHRSLTTLNDAELDHEIDTSRAMIQHATGVRPTFFAYPYGDWDSRVRDRVRAAGYLAALTLDTGLNRSGADRWSLRRINVPAGISDAAFEAWAAGLCRER
jgi:peptidoglycan/xylan/chitin deacetylase (PgdA/CDA1 family)